MARTMRLAALAVLMAVSLSGCYVGVHAGPGWHRCGWGWCR